MTRTELETPLRRYDLDWYSTNEPTNIAELPEEITICTSFYCHTRPNHMDLGFFLAQVLVLAASITESNASTIPPISDFMTSYSLLLIGLASSRKQPRIRYVKPISCKVKEVKRAIGVALLCTQTSPQIRHPHHAQWQCFQETSKSVMLLCGLDT